MQYSRRHEIEIIACQGMIIVTLPQIGVVSTTMAARSGPKLTVAGRPIVLCTFRENRRSTLIVHGLGAFEDGR